MFKHLVGKVWLLHMTWCKEIGVTSLSVALSYISHYCFLQCQKDLHKKVPHSIQNILT